MSGMNLKCKSSLITVYAPGRGSYDYATQELKIGNVYEKLDESSTCYKIVGARGWFPTYLFDVTTEPITPVDMKAIVENQRALIAEQEKEREAERIRDSMDQYYCPERYMARQLRREALVRNLSEVFVQGISY